MHIREDEIDPVKAHGGIPVLTRANRSPVLGDIAKRPLIVFAGCVVLFQLANAAMLPLMGGIVTRRSSDWATVLIAACIVVPQLVVALISPWVGRQAQLGTPAAAAARLRRAAGPRRPVRVVTDPYLLVAVQVLDGITAAVFGVMVPLIIADVTRGTGHFNLAQGIVGSGVGIGASLSTTLAGYSATISAAAPRSLLWPRIAARRARARLALMPETRPERIRQARRSD